MARTNDAPFRFAAAGVLAVSGLVGSIGTQALASDHARQQPAAFAQSTTSSQGTGADSSSPVALTKSATVGDLEIKVTGTNEDATDLILQIRPDAQQPTDDQQFTSANLAVTNNGDEDLVLSETEFLAVDGNGKQYSTRDNACGTPPIGLDGETSIAPGESTEINVCWLIDRSSMSTLEMAVQRPDAEPVWFSLGNPVPENAKPISLTGENSAATAAASKTDAPTATVEPTATTAPTEAPTATMAPTATEEPTNTPEPTATATMAPTATTAPTNTPEPTATTAPTNTPEPTATATMEPTATTAPTNTPEPTATATMEPTATTAPTNTPEPTATATMAPTATTAPTNTPEPTATATMAPTATTAPTNTPEPTATATMAPTATTAPTNTPEPTATATMAPTATTAPTEEPTSSAVLIASATPEAVTPTPSPDASPSLITPDASPSSGDVKVPDSASTVIASPESSPIASPTGVANDDATPVVTMAASPDATAAVSTPMATPAGTTNDQATPAIDVIGTPVDPQNGTPQATPAIDVIASPAASPPASPMAVVPNPDAKTTNGDSSVGLVPLKAGEVGRVGDYEIIVIGPVVQAHAPVASPAASTSLKQVSYAVQIRYVGTGTGTPYQDLVFASTGGSGTRYETQCPPTEKAIMSVDSMKPGDTVTGTVCWMVSEYDVPNMLMSVKPAREADAVPLWFDVTP